MADHTARQSRQKIRRIARWRSCIVGLLILSTLLPFTGCRAYLEQIVYNEYIDETFVSIQNFLRARKAWEAREACYEHEPLLYDFRAGFYRGYQDVAQGKDGCTPLFPPRHYWNWYNRNAEGYARIQAWFAGYPHGVIAAQEDGVGAFTKIPTEPAITRAITRHLDNDPAVKHLPPPPVMELPPVEEVGPRLPEALPEPSAPPLGVPSSTLQLQPKSSPEGKVTRRKQSPAANSTEPAPFLAVETFAQPEAKPQRIRFTSVVDSPENTIESVDEEKLAEKNTKRRGIRIRVVRDIAPSETESALSDGPQE